jgi:ABC-2 type transport system permease protein
VIRQVAAVARKEFRQIARDRRTLLILLFVPVFFLLLFGYALNFDVRHIKLAVQDDDRSKVSRQIISAFVNSGYFELVTVITDISDASELLNGGRVRAVLVIPAGTGRLLLTGRSAPVQLLIDGDNANTATTVVSYSGTILRNVSEGFSLEHAVRPPPIVTEPRVWYNPELRSSLFLVPGLIAYLAMITAVTSTALSVVREKERGTMEQIRMSPVGAFPYVLGKSVPYFTIAFASSIGIVLGAMALFELPMRGSWPLLLFAIALFLAGALGLGLLVSTIADTQQVAFQIALLASFLPTLMLSGFIFPIASMPAVLQGLTYIVPARYFLSALRGIVLKGADLSVFWRELAALAIFAGLTLTLSSIRLRRQWS